MLEAGTGMGEGPRIDGGTNYKAGNVFIETPFGIHCDCFILQMRNVWHPMHVRSTDEKRTAPNAHSLVVEHRVK